MFAFFTLAFLILQLSCWPFESQLHNIIQSFSLAIHLLISMLLLISFGKDIVLLDGLITTILVIGLLPWIYIMWLQIRPHLMKLFHIYSKSSKVQPMDDSGVLSYTDADENNL
jgi:type IV secretory pathway TrbD component